MAFMIRKALKSDMEKMQPYMDEFRLDSWDFDCEKAFVYEVDKKIAGFGRFRNYGKYFEIATIGVLEPYRGRGIGKAIMKHLISIIPPGEIWLTTIIPDYFKKFGFISINKNIPRSLELKAQNLCKKFNRPIEPLVFMYFHKNLTRFDDL